MIMQEWVTFAARHKSMNTGCPEDENDRINILGVLSKLYHSHTNGVEAAKFAQHCRTKLQGRESIPVEPNDDSYCSPVVPHKLYLPSVGLDGLAGAIQLMKVDPKVSEAGVSDIFLRKIGVTAVVTARVIFDHWESGADAGDPNALIELLKAPSLPRPGIRALSDLQFLQAKNSGPELFQPKDLCFPNVELRSFSSFLKILKWPCDFPLNGEDPTRDIVV